MTVRSNPPGATVYVDDQEIGRTPVSTSFTYYGTRKVQLLREGYETLNVKEKVSPPWYEWPVLEFVSENLWPWEIRDERVLDFEMVPEQVVDPQVVAERGQNLRDQAVRGEAIPLMSQPPAQPVGP